MKVYEFVEEMRQREREKEEMKRKTWGVVEEIFRKF